ncbi:nitrosoguanidine resistance protein SNG1 [Penicillium canescens]|nr:nitrosoguanidine resistance protein SNG1 [Penicillium canescens]KAJ6154571.1 nitrosoguanidine resistance protein SNG1 [Penicillium canescens]
MAMNGISSHFESAMDHERPDSFFASFRIVHVWLIWGVRESWDVNETQFVLTWMIVWLYMHIKFGILDILTTFIPTQYLPFCALNWVIINVSSTISPFELQPGFYK